MKQENKVTQPSCIENASSPQRPKRSTGPKSLDNSNGLLWTEEKELKKALYASLQESRKMLVNDDATKGVKNDTRQGQLGIATSKHANSGEVSPKRTRVHAQRKFAQGSTPNSPVPTPVKVSSVNNVATDLFPSRRPKTEDFLTFLCLRGTPILPKAFDFLNNYTRGVSDSEGEPELESDPDDTSSQRGQSSVKPEVKGKPNGLSTGLENGNIPRKNLAKALTPKKKGDKDSSDSVSPVSIEAAPTKNPQQTKLENGIATNNKRKTSPEQEEPCKKKRLASSSKLSGSTTALGMASQADESPKHSSVEALKEKYKKQRLAKQVQQAKPPKEAAKTNKSITPAKKVEKVKTGQRWTSKSKQHKPAPAPSPPAKLKSGNKAKQHVLTTRRVLRSRKSLRMSSRKRPFSIGVMPHVRKAKLVPPVVDFDSDESDLESECSVESKEDNKPPAKSLRKEPIRNPSPVRPSKSSSEKQKPKVSKTSSSSLATSKKTNQGHGHNSNKSSSTSANASSTSTSKKGKSDSKKKSSSSAKKPSAESTDDSEEDVPMRLTRSAKAKEALARIASLSKNHKLVSKKKSSSKKKHLDKKASKKSSEKKSEKLASESGDGDGKKVEKSTDEKKVSQKKLEKLNSKKSAKRSGISKSSKKLKSSSKKLKSPDKDRDKSSKKKDKSSGKNSAGKDEKKSESCSHQKSKKHKGHSSSKLQKLLEDLEDVEENDIPLSLISSKGFHGASKSSEVSSSKTVSEESTQDKDKKNGSKKSKSSSKKVDSPLNSSVGSNSSNSSKKTSSSKGQEGTSKTSKMFFKSSSSEKLALKSKDSLIKKLGKSSSTTDISGTKDDIPLSLLAKKQLVYDQFDFSDSSDSFSDFQPLKKKRKPNENTLWKEDQPSKEKQCEKEEPKTNVSSDSDSDLCPLQSIVNAQSNVPCLKSTTVQAKKSVNSSDSNSTPKKSKPSGKEGVKVQKVKKDISANQKPLESCEKDTSASPAGKQVTGNVAGNSLEASANKTSEEGQKEALALASSEETLRHPASPPALSVPPDCPPDYVEAASYMVQEMSEEVPGLESVSDEAARTLPSDLVFGTPEDIHGLMTSEFSGVFDEAFTTGAILLTTRDTLAQIPLNFLHELTPTKTVVDAATNTCEDDILSCTQVETTPTKNDETSVGTQTMTPVASPAPPLLESVVPTALKTPMTPPAPSSSFSSSSSSTPKQKPKLPKTTLPLATFASKKRNKIPKKPKLEAKEPFPLPSDPPKLTEAPVYHPSLEEFQDPLEFIKKIQPEAEKYGICKIVPPSSFKPECKVNDDMRFTAHNQYVHKMLYRWGPNVQHLACIRKHLKAQGVTLDQSPLIGGIELDLSKFYHTVRHFGGLQQVIEKKKWQRVADAMHIPKAAQERVTKLYDAYCKYLVSYDLLPEEEKLKLEADVVAEHEQKLQQNLKDREDEDSDDENGDCVVKGRSTSLSSFYRIARNTMAMWYKNDPSPEEVENDFWKIVEERKQHVVVHAGNIDSSVYGSGFPSGKSSAFAKHPWNLKVLTNNSGSILRCMGPVSGVTIPTLHVGMLFTTGCWYRDPHCLPWIEYLHTGASKMWYGIPASFYEQFRMAMNKIMPYCCTSNPIWLPSDTAMVPPTLLVEQGCSLSRVVQHSGQFIVVFPGAFTSTICCGYSVSESVYFATPEWLDLAEQAFQAIQLSHEPPAFSLERLLFSIVNDAKTGIETLARLLPMVSKVRNRELQLRAELNELGLKVAERLPLVECRDKKRRSKGQDEDNEQECEVCRTYCYISMVVNSQDDSIYCLDHARAHVQKKKNLKFCKLMFTYDEEELNEIVRKTVQLMEVLEQKGLAKKKSPKKKTP